jgi:hypothetical protein
MIPARDARALYDRSGAEAEKQLLQIEPVIINAANEGRCNVFFLLGSEETHRSVKPTQLQSQVMDKLHALGYRVQFCRYGEEYVPRALVDDCGKGPKHTNFGFALHW